MWGSTHPIDSSAPNPAAVCPDWPNSETVNCYYVDNTHRNATDVWNEYGSPKKPRVSPPSSAKAGAYIEIHGGRYEEEKYDFTFTGTAEKPVWFRGTPGEMPIFTGRFFVRDSQYLFIEYIDFNGGYDGSVNTTENPRDFEGGWPKGSIKMTDRTNEHICIRNNTFRKKKYGTSNTAAIDGSPDEGYSLHDIIIYNNTFYQLGDWDTTEGDLDFHAIYPNLWGIQASVKPVTENYNWWILENTAYRSTTCGI